MFAAPRTPTFARDGFGRPLSKTVNLKPIGFRVWRQDFNHPMNEAHTHADIELNYILGDGMRFRHGGISRRFHSHTLLVFWAGVPHQTLRCLTPSDGVWIYLPLTWLLQWRLPNDFAGRLMAGELFTFSHSRKPFERWLDEFKSADPDVTKLLQLELRTALTRFAIDQGPSGCARGASAQLGTDGGDQHIARITSYLAQNYTSPVTTEEIARHIGLNQAYLLPIFRRHCHMSIHEYLTRLRVSHAQRLLATTSLRVLDIALECGFGSASRFYTAFARYTDCRPQEFRRRQTAPQA